MDIVNNFKSHLFTDRNKPSKVTVKNYISDVRKFIQWFERTEKVTFSPSGLTTEVVKRYKDSLYENTQGSPIATRSAKRYISSLRKFCRFLRDSGAIEANPFDGIITDLPKIEADPWQIKSYKNSLVSSGASKLTIKNYLHDIQQFLLWFEKVTVSDVTSRSDRFIKIDTSTVEHYKERLMGDSKFSPTSINRKLSSLRRYLRWLSDQGLVKKEEAVVVESTPVVTEETIVEKIIPAPEPMPLEALKEIDYEEELPKETKYSNFAPIRLGQKTSKFISHCFDSLLFNPIAKVAEAIQYSVWKSSGKNVFTPVNTILENAGHKLPVTPIEIIKPKKINTITRLTTRTAAVVGDLVRIKTKAKPYIVRNISKSFYAPLDISLRNLPWYKKVWHHMRHTRPAWYRKYHSYPIAHHIHLAVLMFAMAVAGVASYQVATEPPSKNTAALASQPISPPRTLAFQGRLMDKTNTPITAETNLRFALYNSPSASGAALLWQETQTVTPDQDGYFTTALGKKATLSQQLLTSNPNLYVGLTVGKETELQPRRQIATTGLASNSQSLQGLKPITNSAATENVILALDSSGDLTIGGNASPTFQATGGQFAISGQTLLLTTNPDSNGNIQLTTNGSGIIDMQAPIQNTTSNNTIAGIPGAVTITDIVAILGNTSGRSALTVKQNSGDDIISGFSNEVAKFRVNAAGDGMFAGNIAINGNTIATNNTTFGIANTNVINLSIGDNATSLSLGGKSGVTTINNSIEVKGESKLNGTVTASGVINANEGITVASGKNFTLTGFTPGALPFIGENAQLIQDPSIAWNQSLKAFNVAGSVCVRATAGACAGSTPGTIYAANTTVQAADLAENYVSAQQLEPGDVVIPESLQNNQAIVKSTTAYQQQVIGIISTKPGFTLNSDAAPDADHPNVYPLALQGRVPVKVTTSNGTIKAGDPLTSSNIPGVAMKATKPGQIIARALESYENTDQSAIGKVMSFVNISYQAPQSQVTDAGNLNLAVNAGIATISDQKTATDENGFIASIVKVTEITTKNLNITTSDFFINGQHIDDYITGIVRGMTGANNTQLPSPDALDGLSINATASAEITLAEPRATTAAMEAIQASSSAVATIAAERVATPAATIIPIYNSIPTPTRALILPTSTVTPTASPSVTPSDTASPAAEFNSEVTEMFKQEPQSFMDMLSTPSELGLEKLDTKNATVSDTLSVLGRTTLSDVGITGKVTIGLMNINGLDDEGTATINTASGPLRIQSDGFNGVDFLNGKVAIDTQGNLKVNGNAFFAKDVTVKGKLAANVIAPVPGSDLTVENNQGKDVVRVSQKGDVEASGAGKFANINIVRGVQADTSAIETQSNNSAGKGVIKAKQKERTIVTPYVTKDSLIYVTATSDTQKMTLYVARQTAQDVKLGNKGSFSIQIPSNATKDISFNWWIVN